MKKSLLVGGAFLIIIIILGIYFLMRNNTRDSSITQKDILQNDLLVAENKLKKEKENLNIMMDNLRDSFPLAVSVQDQMKKGLKIVSQTDFMFIDPNGLNPQLIIKDFPTFILINKERKNINLLLVGWQNKIDILYIEKIDTKESEQIKRDAETIKTYLNNLSHLVGTLTPENSGISQFQIDSFLSNLPSQEAIDEVLVSLQTAIDNSQTLNTQTSSSSREEVTLVTPGDVVAQEEIVDQAQIEVITLQEQLTQIEEQNSAETNTNTQINSILEDQNTINIDSTNDDVNLTNQDDSSVNNNPTNDHQGIIIQPGLPQLIQGTNQY